MSVSNPIEVQVVYDSARPGGKRSGVTRKTSGRSRALAVVAWFSVAVSGAMYYAIWWRVDPWLNITMIMRTPIGETKAGEPDLEDAAAVMFRIAPDRKPKPAPQPPPDHGPEPLWTGMKAAAIIGATAYSWLTVATLACCGLALAAGSSLAAESRTPVRLVGAAIAVVIAAVLAYAAYRMSQYSMGFKVSHLRYLMGGLVALSLAVGLMTERRRRRITRLAAYSLVVAGASSVVGLYLWFQCGAVEAQYASPTFLAITFLVHSSWGWLLLPLSFRM